MVEQLRTLKLGSDNLFKNVDKWKHQIAANDGGAESFDKFAPFAFVSYLPPAGSTREGDGDLNQQLRFAISLGFKSKAAGDARQAISKARELVIDFFDDWHPGDDFECDPFYFDGDEANVDSETRSGMMIFFKANLID